MSENIREFDKEFDRRQELSNIESQDTAEWHHTRAATELDVIKERIIPGTMPTVANLDIAIHSAEEITNELLDALKYTLAELDQKDISLACRYRIEEAIAKEEGRDDVS